MPHIRVLKKKISWELAKRIVIDSYSEFDESFGEIAEKFLKIHGSMLLLKKVKLPELFHIPQYQVVTQKFF